MREVKLALKRYVPTWAVHAIPIRHAAGRCWACNRAYHWPRKKGMRLRDVSCPTCDGRLSMTTRRLLSAPWFEAELVVFARKEAV